MDNPILIVSSYMGKPIQYIIKYRVEAVEQYVCKIVYICILNYAN